MTSILQRLLLASMVTMVLLLTNGCTKPGVKELRKSRDAVREANSWQEDASVQDEGRWKPLFLSKVECPSRRDLMWVMRPPKEKLDTEGRAIVHEIWYDGTWYTSDGRIWNTVEGAEKKIPGKLDIGCGEGPARVWDGSLYAELDDIIRKGEIRPGPKMTENGFDCRWWDVVDAPGQVPHYAVCINETSHLPQVVRSHENTHEYTYTLSQWNTTSVGLPPELSR